MSIDLADIALAIAPSLTQRTLDNLRRTLEQMYVSSTAQGATPEDAAAFTPELIARAHESAMRDNARTIVTWAAAIQAELLHAKTTTDSQESLQLQLAVEGDKLRHFKHELAELEAGTIYQTVSAEERERYKSSLEKAVQRAAKELLGLTQALRGVSQPQAPVPGRAPYKGPWEASAGYRDLDGDLPPVP